MISANSGPGAASAEKATTTDPMRLITLI